MRLDFNELALSTIMFGPGGHIYQHHRCIALLNSCTNMIRLLVIINKNVRL